MSIILFAGINYYPSSGLADYIGTFDTEEDAIFALKSGVFGFEWFKLIFPHVSEEGKLLGLEELSEEQHEHIQQKVESNEDVVKFIMTIESTSPKYNNPVHKAAYYPAYKLKNRNPDDLEVIEEATAYFTKLLVNSIDYKITALRSTPPIEME